MSDPKIRPGAGPQEQALIRELHEMSEKGVPDENILARVGGISDQITRILRNFGMGHGQPASARVGLEQRLGEARDAIKEIKGLELASIAGHAYLGARNNNMSYWEVQSYCHSKQQYDKGEAQWSQARYLENAVNQIDKNSPRSSVTVRF